MNITNNAYHIYILLALTSLFTLHTVTCEMDTISMNQTLKDGETMISSEGSFEMGFFSPGTSTNRYVGIWYKNVSVQTVVWVANREAPLTNTSGLLRLMEQGVLVIEDGAKGIIWFINASRTHTVPNPVVQLLDSGNLVVKDANDDNPDNLFWQSFDYPTDTLLPGMKLGWNYVTNREVYLLSWKSNEDPAPGNFTYHLDPTGYPQLILKKDAVEQFRSGPWNGMGFSGKPNLRQNSIYRFDVVISKNEVYYVYELLNSSVITRLTLNSTGLVQRWIWIGRIRGWVLYLMSPVDTCDDYNICGVYGTCDIAKSPTCGCLDGFFPIYPNRQILGKGSDGCVRKEQFNCGKGDTFRKYSGIKLPDTRNSRFNTSMTLKECERLCAVDCSCMAYANTDISGGGSGCLIWNDELLDIKILVVDETQDFYIRMGSSMSVSGSGPSGMEGKLAASVSIVMGVVLIGVGLMLYARRRKKINRKQRETRGRQHGYLSNRGDERRKKDLELPLFDFCTITKATDNFSINNKLGEGGFGPVYKGLLEEGQEIAVKRLSKTSFQGMDEFMNEVTCIAKHQHRNLVKLIGCCIQGEENILVYEYMCNKSLDFFLFDPAKSILLGWRKRFHIINGIARGLLYLHQDSRLRIIHRDLKASNVLLDSDMNPKISDFGLAKSFGGNETAANTNRIVGTYGYMSPEYAAEGLFSVKSDVFSFGVLVLEIVTGKRNRGFSHIDHYLNLLGHAWIMDREGRSLELIDPCLGSSHNISEVTRSIQVGLLCVQQCPEDRPSMSSVVMMLVNEGVLPQAKQPGFFTGKNVINVETPVSSMKPCSTNEMSVTLLEGR